MKNFQSGETENYPLVKETRVLPLVIGNVGLTIFRMPFA